MNGNIRRCKNEDCKKPLNSQTATAGKDECKVCELKAWAKRFNDKKKAVVEGNGVIRVIHS